MLVPALVLTFGVAIWYSRIGLRTNANVRVRDQRAHVTAMSISVAMFMSMYSVILIVIAGDGAVGHTRRYAGVDANSNAPLRTSTHGPTAFTGTGAYAVARRRLDVVDDAERACDHVRGHVLWTQEYDTVGIGQLRRRDECIVRWRSINQWEKKPGGGKGVSERVLETREKVGEGEDIATVSSEWEKTW